MKTSHAGQVGHSDRETLFGLHGAVTELVEMSTPSPGIPPRRGVRAVTRFKPDGNRVDHTVWNDREEFISRYVYTYDEQGRRAGPRFYRGAEDALDHTVKFVYQPDGRRREYQEQRDSAGRLQFSVRFGYDAEGRRVEQRWIAPDGAVMRIYRTAYDAAGNRAEQRGYRADESLEWVIRTVFDDRHRPRRVLRREGWRRSSIELRRYHADDAQGNWIAATRWQFFVARGVVPVVLRDRITRQIRYEAASA